MLVVVVVVVAVVVVVVVVAVVVVVVVVDCLYISVLQPISHRSFLSQHLGRCCHPW